MRRIVFFSCFIFLLGFYGSASAGEVDILIDKLVQKGVLNESEVQELVKEIKQEETKNQEEMKRTVQEIAQDETQKAGLNIPEWVEKMKVKGDVRLRYQDRDRKSTPPDFERRGRVRLRVGVESQINDQWKAGLSIASGGSDPRSTNWTLENTFEKSAVHLDKAYAQYRPTDYVKIIGGKFSNPLYKTKDLLWDGDITTDGIALTTNFKPFSNMDLFLTPAYFILNEHGDSENYAGMLAIQAGLKWNFLKHTYLKVAGTGYYNSGVKGNDFSQFGSGSNSTSSGGNLLYDYNSLAFDAEIGSTNIPGPIPFVALFGQGVESDADQDNQGYLVGLKFGQPKVKDWGDWQAKYNYRRLERDAWPDFLPDSDFYDGATNAKGHEFEFTFGLHKNVAIAMDYYEVGLIRYPMGSTEEKEKLLQIDLNIKW